MFNTLSYIGEKLNNSNIIWGVGASILLNHFGLIDKPNDIDIMVDINNIKKADEVLRSIGEKKISEKSDIYSTRYFYEYVINDIDVDVMAGLRINHSNGIFEYNFDCKSISEIKKINGVNIPLTYLEDWYIIYQLIPNRKAKVDMIEKYILTNGIKNKALLERLLSDNLPLEVKHRVENLVNTINNIFI